MTDVCDRCGAKCCRYFCFEIDEPDSYAEFEDVRWYLFHEGVSVHVDADGDWYISIANPCTALDENGRCTAYENRPLICRKYDPSGCDETGGDYEYRHEFKTPEDLERYARKTLGEESFRRSRRRANGKHTVAPKPAAKKSRGRAEKRTGRTTNRAGRKGAGRAGGRKGGRAGRSRRS